MTYVNWCDMIPNNHHNTYGGARWRQVWGVKIIFDSKLLISHVGLPKVATGLAFPLYVICHL